MCTRSFPCHFIHPLNRPLLGACSGWFVLGAKDKDIFVKVVFPATTPFILTAVRLGVSVALTTLIAAESTGASAGMGMRIRSFSNSFEVAPMLLYIILIGIIGITSEKIIKTLEKKLTGWQEKREI